MATPTFAGEDLTTKAEKMQPACPQARLAYDTLPGVDGEYVQAHGLTGRAFRITGIMESTECVTRALALSTLRETITILQNSYVGTYDNFVDGDGVPWDDAVLESFVVSGPYYFRPGTTDKTKFVCGGQVAAVIRSVAGP